MRVLLFGGSGFIGQALARNLLASGHEVGIYADTQPSPDISCTFHEGKLYEDQSLRLITKGYDAAVYLISTTVPASSMLHPEWVYQRDISMIRTALNACAHSGIRRFVFSSSGGAVYGNVERPARESDPAFPLCHYGVGKLACEQIISIANRMYGMEGISLRIANPFGIGQGSNAPIGAISVFARKALKGEPITVYGSGDNIRDYLDVAYVAQAFTLALTCRFNSDIMPVFNIGSGVGLSVNDILGMVVKVTGKPCHVKYASKRLFDVERIVLDVHRAIETLGYIPPADPIGDIQNYIHRIAELYKKEATHD